MLVSITEIWFLQSSAEMQRMKFLVWLRSKCVAAGYDNVRLWGRSVIGKPADASDYALVVECTDDAKYYQLLPTIAQMCSGMQKRFVEAGGLKWGESLFVDAAPPLSGLCSEATHEEMEEIQL